MPTPTIPPASLTSDSAIDRVRPASAVAEVSSADAGHTDAGVGPGSRAPLPEAVAILAVGPAVAVLGAAACIHCSARDSGY